MQIVWSRGKKKPLKVNNRPILPTDPAYKENKNCTFWNEQTDFIRYQIMFDWTINQSNKYFIKYIWVVEHQTESNKYLNK